MISGIGGQGRVCGGRGSRGCGRGSAHYTPILNINKVLRSALGKNIFDYGQKEPADQIQTIWEKIVHHVGTIYGHYFSKVVQNKTKFSYPKP